MHGLADSLHLAKRFVTSLVPLGPSAHDAVWAQQQLASDEMLLWDAMPPTDRRHSVAVARRVERSLGDDATRPVLAAALLHDVGKIQSGLGTFGRVAATLTVGLVGRSRTASWSERPGVRGRVSRYLRHPELGAVMLSAAGSDAVTIAWAREHHLHPAECSLPSRIATALRAADDD